MNTLRADGTVAFPLGERCTSCGSQITVAPVPLCSPAGPRPMLTFVHSAELVRLLEHGDARMCDATSRASGWVGFRFEVRLEREFIAPHGQTWAAQWLPVLVDDSLPRWGLWDVLGFFQAHAAIPNPSPTPNDDRVNRCDCADCKRARALTGGEPTTIGRDGRPMLDPDVHDAATIARDDRARGH